MKKALILSKSRFVFFIKFIRTLAENRGTGKKIQNKDVLTQSDLTLKPSVNHEPTQAH